MTLIDAFKTPCVLMERVRTSDGEGGWTTAWSEGVGFNAAIVLDSSINAKIAESQGVTGIYTITTDPNAELAFHDVVKRIKDGKTFRVTKINDSPPNVATFDFNQYQAEAWELA